MKLRVRPLGLAIIGLVLTLMLSAVAYAALGDRVLARGATGPEVRELQQKLSRLGFVVGPIDGKYGSRTQAAVTRYQRERGLKVDGVAGPQTINDLKLLSGESTTAAGKPVGYKDSDVNLLARLVNAEARGEPYKGQVAVAAVVLNRIKSSEFPNTIAGIVYQPAAFSGVSDGQINFAPQASAIRAAREAMSGVDPSYGALFFFNPAKTSNKYIWSRPQITKIGNHIFAR